MPTLYVFCAIASLALFLVRWELFSKKHPTKAALNALVSTMFVALIWFLSYALAFTALFIQRVSP